MQKSLFLFATLLFLMSCGGNDATSNTDRVLFKYNQPENITSLDPAFAKAQNNIWATNHLFNSLVQLDDDLNVQPCIAQSWLVSDDGLTYTFTIRDDIFFHDNDAFTDGKGRKVVAEDVVYSLNRIIDPATGSPGSWIFRGKVTENTPFSATDDKTFVLKLVKPFPPMLGLLAMQYCSVVPKEAIEKYGKDFRSNPVGTGPFQLKTWVENQALVMVKNEQYFEEENGKALPNVDGIRIDFIADRKTAYLEFDKGKFDFLNGLESSYVNALLTKEGELKAEKAATIDFYKTPFLNSEYLGILMDFSSAEQQKNPLRHKEVRQALNYGFDRVKMLRELRNNVGKPANSGFTPKGLPSFDDKLVKGYNYDPDRARTLLKKAGYPDGKNMPEIKLYTNSNYMDLCTFIARQWEDLGVKTKIELMDGGTLREMMSRGQAPFFRASWIADYPDAENFFSVFYSKNPSPPNYTQFNNAKFDELYESALTQNDVTLRNTIYQEMDKILVEEAPVIFLFYDESARFTQKNIKGLSTNAINLLSVRKVVKN